MLFRRTASWTTLALFVALLAVPAVALAATPPVLEAPASGASSFKEGDAMKFEWRGTLQGDPDTLARSFFRLEIIKAADMPSGAQSEWTKVENFVPTEPGVATTELEVGVPSAGTYRWRVCAWGVIDDVVANEIVQLPGGCSASRAFETVAVTDKVHGIGELKVEERVQVPGRVETVTVNRPSPVEPAEPQPVTPAPVEPPKPEPIVPATFSDVISRELAEDGTALSLGDSASPLSAEAAADRKGLSGTVLDGLSATLPLLPIPFWTLALLLACLPVARAWRTNVLAMFDWSDGTIDGSGRFDRMHDDLATVPVAHELKVRSISADADAPAQVGTSFSAPDRGRRAA